MGGLRTTDVEDLKRRTKREDSRERMTETDKGETEREEA